MKIEPIYPPSPPSGPQPWMGDRQGEVRESAYYLCGYNGPGYYQPTTHPCAAKYHAVHSKQGNEQ